MYFLLVLPQSHLKSVNNTQGAGLMTGESGQKKTWGKQASPVAQASPFILQSDVVEAHQGEQSVTVDLRPRPQQSQGREVYGRRV